MKKALAVSALVWSSCAMAAVVNVEYQFTPFVGDIKASEVQAVPGKARVFLNNVPVAEQDVEKTKLPVIFDSRDISAAVWVPLKSMGQAVRKGRNVIRIEFEPRDAKAAYQARLQWAQVTDQVKEESRGNTYTTTNQAGEGRETRPAQGKVVFEKEFSGDFAADAPWHHYPPVASLSDDDKQKLAALVKERAEAFAPKFDKVYKILEGRPDLQVGEARQAKCLDKAHAAGVRVPVPNAGELEFATTGSAAVAVGRKGGPLYALDPKSFARIKGDQMQMCAGIMLAIAYPPRLVVVRTPAGAWEPVSF